MTLTTRIGDQLAAAHRRDLLEVAERDRLATQAGRHSAQPSRSALPRRGLGCAGVSQPGVLPCLMGCRSSSIEELMMRVFVAGAVERASRGVYNVVDDGHRGASNAKPRGELARRPAHPSWRHGFATA
jgi:hypothetical protein